MSLYQREKFIRKIRWYNRLIGCKLNCLVIILALGFGIWLFFQLRNILF